MYSGWIYLFGLVGLMYIDVEALTTLLDVQLCSQTNIKIQMFMRNWLGASNPNKDKYYSTMIATNYISDGEGGGLLQ